MDGLEISRCSSKKSKYLKSSRQNLKTWNSYVFQFQSQTHLVLLLHLVEELAISCWTTESCGLLRSSSRLAAGRSGAASLTWWGIAPVWTLEHREAVVQCDCSCCVHDVIYCLVRLLGFSCFLLLLFNFSFPIIRSLSRKWEDWKKLYYMTLMQRERVSQPCLCGQKSVKIYFKRNAQTSLEIFGTFADPHFLFTYFSRR